MSSFRELNPVARWVVALLSFATLGALITAGVPSMRHSVLRSAGWALVAEDATAKADIIVISTDSRDAGILEAADLVHAGFATRVAIFGSPATRVSREFARRGVQTPDLNAAAIQLLHQLGVADIALIPSVAGTADEGNVLRHWCPANSIHSILFVSVPDHSRRTRRILNRALGQIGVQVRVRIARFGEFDPDSWWQSRGGQRTQAVETEKLLADMLIHPL